MTGTLFAKALRDGRLLLWPLLVFMFGFTWLQIWVSSKISLSAFSEFLINALPKRWEQISGVPFSEVATTAGRIAVTFVHPLILTGCVAWAIARGSDCVSGEIGRGTMEMLLAQPVRRSAVYLTQALATVLGAALLAFAVWCGTVAGLATVELPEVVPAIRFIPPSFNLFALTVCIGGMSALASSWGSQRWQTIGLMCGWYIISTVFKVVGRIADGWNWLTYVSFMTPFEPQMLVARPQAAWSVFAYENGSITGLGLGGQQIVLIVLGLICYVAGAVVFSRRELPAPL
jgi:ABC-2 type transport system permease protein